MIKIGHMVKVRQELFNELLKFIKPIPEKCRVYMIVDPTNNEPLYNLDLGNNCNVNVLGKDIIEVEDCGQKLLFW